MRFNRRQSYSKVVKIYKIAARFYHTSCVSRVVFQVFGATSPSLADRSLQKFQPKAFQQRSYLLETAKEVILTG